MTTIQWTDETWNPTSIHRIGERGDPICASVYDADGEITPADAWPWKADHLPSIHCPRGLSRITLEVTGVRVERVQAITEEDAQAEGVSSDDLATLAAHGHRFAFQRLWQSINGKRTGCSWDANPFVWDDASAPVIGHPSIDNFPAQVADPRVRDCNRGSFGVQAWAEPSHCVRAHHNPRIAPSTIADPRTPEIDGPPIALANKRPTYLVIRAADGTWHRPMTTLELAALQGFPVRNADGTWLVLGGSQADQREHIGNAVPPPAAEAIAIQCRATLLAAAAGGFTLDNGEIWVRDQLAKYSAAAHLQGDASVDTGHSPVAAGLPDASGDAATHQSAIDETHCSNAERGTHGG